MVQYPGASVTLRCRKYMMLPAQRVIEDDIEDLSSILSIAKESDFFDGPGRSRNLFLTVDQHGCWWSSAVLLRNVSIKRDTEEQSSVSRFGDMVEQSSTSSSLAAGRSLDVEDFSSILGIAIMAHACGLSLC